MPPRLRLARHSTLSPPLPTPPKVCLRCAAHPYASLATPPTATTTGPPIQRHPPTQPPSHKPPEFRKSQLNRQYQSLLRSSPVVVVFQHNNLKATEWMAIRRELATALGKVDDELVAKGESGDVRLRDSVKIQVVQTGILAAAIRVVEFWDPDFSSSTSSSSSSSSTSTSESQQPQMQPLETHGLSTAAHHLSRRRHHPIKRPHNLEPLLSGPLALLTLPSVSPPHLAAALSILSPSPAFPAPRRRTTPSYHEPAVQAGVQKLMLLGARVEGRVMDAAGAAWVGGIEGGLGGLRGRLVQMLSGVGGGMVGVLEGVGRGVYFTLEGRRGMMEEGEKGKSRGSAEGDK